MWTFFSFHLSAWFRNGHALLHNITWTLLSTWLLRGRTSSPTRSPISISDAQFPSLFPILPKSPQNVPFPHDGLTPAISPPDSRSTTPIYSTRIPPRSTRPRPPIPAFTILSARSRPRLPSTSTPSPWSRWDVSNGTSSEPSSAMFCSEARFFNSPSHGFWARVAWWCGVVWCGVETRNRAFTLTNLRGLLRVFIFSVQEAAESGVGRRSLMKHIPPGFPQYQLPPFFSFRSRALKMSAHRQSKLNAQNGDVFLCGGARVLFLWKPGGVGEFFCRTDRATTYLRRLGFLHGLGKLRSESKTMMMMMMMMMIMLGFLGREPKASIPLR